MEEEFEIKGAHQASVRESVCAAVTAKALHEGTARGNDSMKGALSPSLRGGEAADGLKGYLCVNAETAAMRRGVRYGRQLIARPSQEGGSQPGRGKKKEKDFTISGVMRR